MHPYDIAYTPGSDWVGVVDCRGHLICKQCRLDGFGERLDDRHSFVYGPPHSEEYCGYCAGLLCNMGEP